MKLAFSKLRMFRGGALGVMEQTFCSRLDSCQLDFK